MANPSIAINIPDPFRNNFNERHGFATITHVVKGQYVAVTGSNRESPAQIGAVAPGQMNFPIHVHPTDADNEIDLPSADDVVRVYRSSVPPLNVNDLIAVPVYNWGTTGAIFFPGVNASGSNRRIEPLSSTHQAEDIVIQLTSLDPVVGYSYTVL